MRSEFIIESQETVTCDCRELFIPCIIRHGWIELFRQQRQVAKRVEQVIAAFGGGLPGTLRQRPLLPPALR